MREFKREIYFKDGFCESAYRIYVLAHPVTGDIFYVGQTKKPLCDRLYGHITAAKGKSDKFRNEEKDKCIMDLLNAGLRPIIKEIEKIKPVSYIEFLEISEREVAWMKILKERGCLVLNVIGLRIPQLNAKYLIYLEQLENKSVDIKYYYCGIDKNGEKLYHKERIIRDGGYWIEDRVPIVNSYNPFSNPIFRKKMGLEA